MSEFVKEKIICPRCSAKGEFTRWESINVLLNPELREQIFSEEIFIWTCPNCGQKVFIGWGTVYHDMKNKFMLIYNAEKAEEDANTEKNHDMQKECAKETKHMHLEINDTGLDKGGYLFRSVYGLMHLKEKILILEHKLNDVAVERMKFMICHLIIPELAENHFEIFFLDVLPDEDEYGIMRFIYIDKNGNSIALKFNMVMYYENKLAVELDQRFATEPGDCVDQDWIERILKKRM